MARLNYKKPPIVDTERLLLEAWAEILTDPDPKSRRTRLTAAVAQIEGILARSSFAEFVQKAWHVLEPGTHLEWNWHHQLMCDVLQAMFHAWQDSKSQRGKQPRARQFDEFVRNAIFSVPPGSLKSRIIGVCFQPWCWLHEPSMKFICLSVNEDATLRDGRMSRDLVKSEWYQSTFRPHWALKTDQDAISNYGNNQGGERLSKPSGSEVVGLRGDVLLIDDPNNPKEAENATERTKINELWTTNIANRVNDPRRSLRIGVQQRVHKQDWTGYVLGQDEKNRWSPENQFGWLNIVLPAEYDPARKFVMPDCLRKYVTWPGAITTDPRELPGESIHPERFTPDYLKSEKERWKHTTNYSGQMQQQPASAEGQLAQRQWWGWFRFAEGVREDNQTGDHPRPLFSHEGPAHVVKQKMYRPGEPDFDWITISVDPAAKKTDKGSAHGLLCVAGKGGKRYVLDDRTQRGAFHEIMDVIKDMIRMWKPDTILIEPKAAGPDLMDTLREQMLSGDVPMVSIEEAEPGNTDKESRFMSCLHYIRNGAVYLLEGASWLKDFLDELSEFPASDQSDRVDALAQVLNFKRPSDDVMPTW